MLRIAILGLGWAGSRHVEAIRELGRKVSVECLVDNDADFLREKATEFGIGKTYTDLGAALKDPDVDAVSICLPHALHCGAAIEAARAGKHVLCEKPMAMTFDECQEMIAACKENGVRLFVAYYRRALPRFVKIKSLIDDGVIGKVSFADVVFHSRRRKVIWKGPGTGESIRRSQAAGIFMILRRIRWIFCSIF